MKSKILFLLAGLVFGVMSGWIIWGDWTLNPPQCLDGMRPDKDGCCAGEVYTDMGDNGWNCCPPTGDCFPPIK